MKRAKSSQKRNQSKSPPPNTSSKHKVPFMEHVRELRRRLFYTVASVMVFGGAAYAVQQQIVAALLRPAHGQEVFFTSPVGGRGFLFPCFLDPGVAARISGAGFYVLRPLGPRGR